MEDDPIQRPLISIAAAVLGVSLIGGSFFVHTDQSHLVISDALQLIMVVAGSIAITMGILYFFIRTAQDIWSG